MAAAASGPKVGFRLRRLDKPEEFRAAEELQREAYGMEGETPVAATVQRAAQDHGGLVLGAFADIYLAGVVIGFLGWDGQELYHYAHALAVRPEYQNHHLGFQLSAFLREEVLRQGLPRARWWMDPLASHAAHLAVHRLGAVPDRYRPHYYGQLDSAANQGIETDRVGIFWDLAAPATEARMAGNLPSAEAMRARWEASGALVETELSDEGLRRPVTVAEPDRPSAHLEIPFDLGIIQQHSPAGARTWRHAVRDAFRAAFDLGYRVDDFVVLNLEHERRSFYLLRAPEPAPAAPSAG
jgi:predicted GNAT superfamily acetyltransferase